MKLVDTIGFSSQHAKKHIELLSKVLMSVKWKKVNVKTTIYLCIIIIQGGCPKVKEVLSTGQTRFRSGLSH